MSNTATNVQGETESHTHDDTHAQDRDDVRGAGDSDDEDLDHSKQGRRKKIEIKFIHEKSKRHITFSKRKSGIMKKAYELSVLTGTEILLLVASETGHIYTFATDKLQPMLSEQSGAPCVSCGYLQNAKHMIQTCLNADGDDAEDDEQEHATENNTMDSKNAVAHAADGQHVPQSTAPSKASDNAHAASGPPEITRPSYTPSQQQVLAAYLQRQRQQEQQQVSLCRCTWFLREWACELQPSVSVLSACVDMWSTGFRSSSSACEDT
eukprot:m.165215 g.165215  ORF g.165215 m.165215 type:complete len:266 (-) comp18129_c0_seq2:713-1510(-)